MHETLHQTHKESIWELESPAKKSSGNFHVRRDYPFSLKIQTSKEQYIILSPSARQLLSDSLNKINTTAEA